MADKLVRLSVHEGDVIEVATDIINKSSLVQSMIDDAPDSDEVIPLPNVKKVILEKIVTFCTYAKDNPTPEIEKPLRSSNLADVVPQWYAQFVELEQETLFELILAANYMDIKPLLELSCAKVASMIKGKSIPEIRKFFNIENDFTPEEEA
jgi:S-phase kinase-associated protein 1